MTHNNNNNIFLIMALLVSLPSSFHTVQCEVEWPLASSQSQIIRLVSFSLANENPSAIESVSQSPFTLCRPVAADDFWQRHLLSSIAIVPSSSVATDFTCWRFDEGTQEYYSINYCSVCWAFIVYLRSVALSKATSALSLF